MPISKTSNGIFPKATLALRPPRRSRDGGNWEPRSPSNRRFLQGGDKTRPESTKIDGTGPRPVHLGPDPVEAPGAMNYPGSSTNGVIFLTFGSDLGTVHLSNLRQSQTLPIFGATLEANAARTAPAEISRSCRINNLRTLLQLRFQQLPCNHKLTHSLYENTGGIPPKSETQAKPCLRFKRRPRPTARLLLPSTLHYPDQPSPIRLL